MDTDFKLINSTRTSNDLGIGRLLFFLWLSVQLFGSKLYYSDFNIFNAYGVGSYQINHLLSHSFAPILMGLFCLCVSLGFLRRIFLLPITALFIYKANCLAELESFNNGHSFFLLTITIINFTDLGYELSIDKLLFKGRFKKPGESPWFISFLIRYASLFYGVAALQKVRLQGFSFFSGKSLLEPFIGANNMDIFLYLSKSPVLLSLMQVGGFLLLISFFFYVFKPKYWWPYGLGLAMIFHASVNYLLGPHFRFHMICYLLTIPYTHLLSLKGIKLKPLPSGQIGLTVGLFVIVISPMIMLNKTFLLSPADMYAYPTYLPYERVDFYSIENGLKKRVKTDDLRPLRKGFFVKMDKGRYIFNEEKVRILPFFKNKNLILEECHYQEDGTKACLPSIYLNP